MNANLIHKWLRDPRFGPVAEGQDAEVDGCGFLPIDVGTSALSSDAMIEVVSPRLSIPLCANRIDITLSDGRRVLVEGPTALSSVLGLVQGLMT
jgi:transposase